MRTDSSLKEFCCERDQRNGRACEIKGEFKIRDIRTSLQADENILSRGRNRMLEREAVFTEGNALGRGEVRSFW